MYCNFVHFADIVFFIFLYQKWVYKVDLKRVNEFGFSGEEADSLAKQLVPAETEAIEAVPVDAPAAESKKPVKPKSAARKKAD